MKIYIPFRRHDSIVKGQKILFSSKSGTYITPLDLYKKLDFYYNFYTDPCTTEDNPLGCKLFFTKETDGLDFRKWLGNVYINPEYGRTVNQWVSSVQLYSIFNKYNVVVMLLPARTDTTWFHRLLEMHNTKFYFFKGRLQFRDTPTKAPFPSMLVFVNDKSIESDGKIVMDF